MDFNKSKCCYYIIPLKFAECFMNMEEIPTTFDKKEISLYRKNIAIAILLRGGMYSNKRNISVNL